MPPSFIVRMKYKRTGNIAVRFAHVDSISVLPFTQVTFVYISLKNCVSFSAFDSVICCSFEQEAKLYNLSKVEI